MRPFFEIDVFSHLPFLGNPLAVVADGIGLTTEQMQHIAAWTKFSETTFLLPPTAPEADYRVRIFTPTTEYSFAGHPTIGSARAWLELGGTPKTPGRIVQECEAGLITVAIDDDGVNATRARDTGAETNRSLDAATLSFATPPRTRTGALSADDVATICRDFALDSTDVVAHAWGSNGPEFRLIQLDSADRVRALEPAPHRAPMRVGFVGLEREKAGTGTAYEVRFFGVGYEDPVTGSLHGALAQWLREREIVPPRYTASQGSRVGRDGRVFVHDDGNDVWIGGRTHVTVRGNVHM